MDDTIVPDDQLTDCCGRPFTDCTCGLLADDPATDWDTGQVIDPTLMCRTSGTGEHLQEDPDPTEPRNHCDACGFQVAPGPRENWDFG